MDSAFSSIFWGIVGSILGTVGGLFYSDLRDWVRMRRGVLTGDWDQVIPAQNNQPEKKDHVECRHVGDSISGDIHRVTPTNEKNKSWGFEGRVRGDLIFLVFWTTNEKDNPGSYGTIQLHRMPDGFCEGHYERWVLSTDRNQFTGKFQEAQLKWLPRRNS